MLGSSYSVAAKFDPLTPPSPAASNTIIVFFLICHFNAIIIIYFNNTNIELLLLIKAENTIYLTIDSILSPRVYKSLIYNCCLSLLFFSIKN